MCRTLRGSANYPPARGANMSADWRGFCSKVVIRTLGRSWPLRYAVAVTTVSQPLVRFTTTPNISAYNPTSQEQSCFDMHLGLQLSFSVFLLPEPRRRSQIRRLHEPRRTHGSASLTPRTTLKVGKLPGRSSRTRSLQRSGRRRQKLLALRLAHSSRALSKAPLRQRRFPE